MTKPEKIAAEYAEKIRLRMIKSLTSGKVCSIFVKMGRSQVTVAEYAERKELNTETGSEIWETVSGLD